MTTSSGTECKHKNFGNCLGCYNEMMDRQFVPDTIEVPVQWLKELVELFDRSCDDELEAKMKMCDHINLIREKL